MYETKCINPKCPHESDKFDAKDKMIFVLIGLLLLALILGSNPHFDGPEYSGVSHVQHP